ncbi:MAG: glycosyltransferase family 4 protein [Lachnospiraceae bacterium]|nr:glycosyltransferase family 4 protein [Lachnospiraceae bacterium]
MNSLILFGAGVYAKKYIELLTFLNMDFDYFTDNDSLKWNTILYNKPVISVKCLSQMPACKIIISCTHETAVRKQLADMGLEKNIIGLDLLYDMCEKKMSKESNQDIAIHNGTAIIIDMYEGIGWGGTELWAANLAYELKKSEDIVILLGGTEQPKLEKRYEALVKRISGKGTMAQMAELMEKNLPCIFVNNFAGCGFMAAIAIKRKHPDLVKIVSVIHNDNKGLFDAHMLMSKYIDKIFCVSSQICEHMKRIYDYTLDCYYFKEQPIRTDTLWERESNMSDRVKIGYAARLVKQQKCADLLVDLLGQLEKKGMDYCMQIVGEGECSKLIEEYIANCNLRNKVQLMGRLPRSEMDSFWKKQDIFVNLSEYEGTSLSMLEAMGYGCVPVVTDVSGAKEFIEPNKNGYICGIGAVEDIADRIVELSENRELLKTYGENCRKIIEERCNPEEYRTYWKEKVLGDWL